MINIYQTQTMIAALQLMPPRPTFLRDRYFPTTEKDIFITEDVLIEYKDEKSRKMAPCVVPRKGGILVPRDGYKTDRITAPYIAPERTLTIDDLNKKQFGETLFSQKTPSARAASYLKSDLEELGELIDTREEYMAAKTLFENGYTLRQYADKYGSGEYEEFDIQFYDEESNPAVYVPSVMWSEDQNDMLTDIYNMAMILKKRGLKAADLLFGADVANTILNDEKILSLLDNRRLDLLSIKPETLPEGATSFGRINCMGIMIELICYVEEFVDEDGTTKTFIPPKKVALTAPAVGRTLYGAVTQMEESDREFHTYANRRVPHLTTNVKDSIRTLTKKARPVCVPNFKNSTIVAEVLA